MHKFYEAARLFLEERKVEATKFMRQGGCTNYEDYRFTFGKLRAYEELSDYLKELHDFFLNGNAAEHKKAISAKEARQREGLQKAQEEEDHVTL